jgi:hypothetical protein
MAGPFVNRVKAIAKGEDGTLLAKGALDVMPMMVSIGALPADEAADILISWLKPFTTCHGEAFHNLQTSLILLGSKPLVEAAQPHLAVIQNVLINPMIQPAIARRLRQRLRLATVTACARVGCTGVVDGEGRFCSMCRERMMPSSTTLNANAGEWEWASQGHTHEIGEFTCMCIYTCMHTQTRFMCMCIVHAYM